MYRVLVMSTVALKLVDRPYRYWRPNAAKFDVTVRILSPEDEGYMCPERRGFGTCQLRSVYNIATHTYCGEKESVEDTSEGAIFLFPLLMKASYKSYFGKDARDLLFSDKVPQESNFLHTSGKFSYRVIAEGKFISLKVPLNSCTEVSKNQRGNHSTCHSRVSDLILMLCFSE